MFNKVTQPRQVWCSSGMDCLCVTLCSLAVACQRLALRCGSALCCLRATGLHFTMLKPTVPMSQAHVLQAPCGARVCQSFQMANQDFSKQLGRSTECAGGERPARAGGSPAACNLGLFVYVLGLG